MADILKYQRAFAKEVEALSNGHHIKKCMQCGMCDIACATRKEMDFSPRELFLLIRAGRKEEVFQSNTIWMCSTCLLCKVRCPREVPLAEVMHDLKSLAIQQGFVDSPTSWMVRLFWLQVWKKGRISELSLMTGYHLKQGWVGIKKSIGLADIGFGMIRCRRISLRLPKKIKGIKGMQAIINKALSQIHREDGE